MTQTSLCYGLHMYPVLIVLHSWIRWAVIIIGLTAVFRAIAARSSGRAWNATDNAAGRFYTIALDLQVLIGLVLYVFASPIVAAARQNMAVSMANDTTRFWLVEHPVAMILALALAHVGRARMRRATADRVRFSRIAVFHGLSVLLVIIGTPWPGMPYGRGLLRIS